MSSNAFVNVLFAVARLIAAMGQCFVVDRSRVQKLVRHGWADVLDVFDGVVVSFYLLCVNFQLLATLFEDGVHPLREC